VSRDQLILKLRDLKSIAEECLRLLAIESDAQPPRRNATVAGTKREAVDFSRPVRPFMKRHSKNLSGSNKVRFTAGVACERRPETAGCVIGNKKELEPDDWNIGNRFQSLLHWRC
jgi:hypothetical protein